MDITANIKELEFKGYTIIHNVLNNDEINDYLNEFNKWRSNVPDLDYLHNIIDFNGIFKHHEVGHQRFAWLARTNKNIINIFKQLWNTDELATSFDGCCYFPSNYKNIDMYWMHTDQSPQMKGSCCYQSFVSLTDNSERTLVLYKESHLLHEKYFQDMNIDNNIQWHIIDYNYLENLNIEHKKIKLSVKKGDLVIWDSRTFHQNSCGSTSCEEERLVQYLCYLPKNSEQNDQKQRNLRLKYFNNRRTTSHWVYPMNAVPLQPNSYNNYSDLNNLNRIYIDYNNLPIPYIDDLLPKIKELL